MYNINIREKLFASRFIVIPHTKRVNVGFFVFTEGICLLLCENFREILSDYRRSMYLYSADDKYIMCISCINVSISFLCFSFLLS